MVVCRTLYLFVKIYARKRTRFVNEMLLLIPIMIILLLNLISRFKSLQAKSIYEQCFQILYWFSTQISNKSGEDWKSGWNRCDCFAPLDSNTCRSISEFIEHTNINWFNYKTKPNSRKCFQARWVFFFWLIVWYKWALDYRNIK